MVVEHITIRGSNRKIGEVLARTAQQAGAPLPRVADATRDRARRRWFERNWPQHYARMEGIAAAHGESLAGNEFDFSRLEPALLPEGASLHCSAMWLPDTVPDDGRARVGRNLDFSVGTVSELLGVSRQPGERPIASRPYIIETHPNDSPASMVITLADFTGCVEGINEHGLTVALLADDVTPSGANTPTPTLVPQAGLNEMHVLRYLLDTCASASEAREALYGAKQYEEYTLVHLLVSDRDEAFVWERAAHNVEHAVDADRDGLCVTNHPLHCCTRPSAVPDDIDGNAAANSSYRRARSLYSSLEGMPLSERGLWDALEAVRADGTTDDPQSADPPTRTVWHAQYDVESRSIDVEFYLGDNDDGSPRRSGRVNLSLERQDTPS